MMTRGRHGKKEVGKNHEKKTKTRENSLPTWEIKPSGEDFGSKKGGKIKKAYFPRERFGTAQEARLARDAGPGR